MCDTMKAFGREPQTVSRDQVKTILEAFSVQSSQLEAVRVMRNCSALNPTVKEELKMHLDEIVAQVSTIAEAVDEKDEDSLLLVRCTMQFMSNFANGEEDSVLEAIKAQPWLQACLDLDDLKARNFAASVVLLLAKAGLPECASQGMLSSLLAAMRAESEFALFSLLTAAKTCDVSHEFKSLSKLDRLTYIDIFTSHLDIFQDREPLLDFLLSYYKQQASKILTTLKTSPVALEPAEFTRLLDLFCELSTEESLQSRLQSDKSLLIDTVYLLRMLHEVGKESDPDGMLAPARKLSMGSQATLENNPVHGFKRDLIRLIGNLCWAHADNKDAVRDMEGIPLLMDCTAIDGKNPLMTEWVIFTLRNLCKDNPANQAIVSGVDDKGLVSVELAKEYGIEQLIKKKT